MRPRDVSELLAATIEAKLPALLTGAPGVGKSDLVAQAAERAGANLIISHPVVADPTDAKGLPWIASNKKEATFLPFGELAEALRADKPTVWFLDDLGQASPAVQASFMQLILARRINGHNLPDHIVFIAATNRRTDRAGVSGILEPVKSRFATIISVEANVDDWCIWALNNNQPVELTAFMRFKPDLLHKFEPSVDIKNSPSPRTWAYAGKLANLKLPAHLELEAIRGAVGEGAAAEFIGFLQVYRSLPSLDSILLDPDNAVLPGTEQVSARYAVAIGLGSRANPKNFDAIARYADRLVKAEGADFAACMVGTAQNKDKSICDTPGYIRLMSGSLGAMIRGDWER